MAVRVVSRRVLGRMRILKCGVSGFEDKGEAGVCEAGDKVEGNGADVG